MSNFRKIKEENKIILSPEGKFERSYDKLPSGVYQLYDIGGMFGFIPCFENLEEKDNLVNFKTGIVSEVIKKTNTFFQADSIAIYKELKLYHKMGILFYGAPGTGKTCTCTLIMRAMVERFDAICLSCTGKTINFILYTIKQIRKYQSNPIVIFMDEFENSIRREEEKYLTFLDGEDSVDGLIFIGCTNYIDSIPDRIRNRKSRIKHLYSINSLPFEVYKEYISDRLPKMESGIINEFCFLAEEKGLTMDQFKHALIDYKLEKVSVKDAVAQAAEVIENEDEKD